MDRSQLIYDVVRAYIVVLAFSIALLLAGVVFAGEFGYRGVTLIWYQLTGVGVLLAVTYHTVKQEALNLRTVGVLFLAWTIYLESLFLVYSKAGPVSVPGTDPNAEYVGGLINNLQLLVLLLVMVLISGVLFVLAIYFIKLVFTNVEAPVTKALLYPLIFGIIIADVVGIALLIPSFPNTFPALSTAVAIWLKTTIFSVGGIGDWFAAHFTLAGINYVLLWVGIDLSIAWPFTLFDVGASWMTGVQGAPK